MLESFLKIAVWLEADFVEGFDYHLPRDQANLALFGRPRLAQSSSFGCFVGFTLTELLPVDEELVSQLRQVHLVVVQMENGLDVVSGEEIESEHCLEDIIELDEKLVLHNAHFIELDAKESFSLAEKTRQLSENRHLKFLISDLIACTLL